MALTEAAKQAWRDFRDDNRGQMGLGSLLGSPVDAITGQANRSMQQGGSQFTLEKQNFDVEFGSSLSAGSWVDLAEFIVGAQTAYNIGYGASDQPDTMGRFYAHFEDGSGNVASGQVRIVTRDANDKNVDTEISALSTSRLDSDANDWRKQLGVPEINRTPKVGEDSKVVVQFKLDSASTATSIDLSASSGTVFMLDLTQY